MTNEPTNKETPERTMAREPEMALSTRVALSLFDDARTYDETIEVVDEQGKITLQGEVMNIKIKEAAEEIAREVPGVVTVVNALKVKRD